VRDKVKTFFVIFLILWASLAGISLFLERINVKIEDRFVPVTVNGTTFDINLLVIKPQGIEWNKNYAIVLFHTLLLSAYSLKPLGIELARRGFVVIIPDLPGHGYSEGELPIFFNASDLGILVASAVTYIKDFFDFIVGYAKKEVNPSGPSNVKLIFIGHSFGGGIALLYAALRKDVCATITISPVGISSVFRNPEFSFFSDYLNRSNPKNVLLIVPPIDEVNSENEIKKVLEILGIERPEIGKIYGDFEDGTARMLIKSSLSEHFTVQFTRKTMVEIIKWISKVTKLNLDTSIMMEPIRVFLTYLSLTSGIFSLFLIGPAISERFGLISGGRRWPRFELKIKAVKAGLLWSFITILFTIMLALPIFLIVAYFEVPALVGPASVFGYYIGSVLSLVLIISKWRKIPAKETIRLFIIELYKDARNVLFGLLIAALLFIIFQSTISQISVPVIIIDLKKLVGLLIFYPLALLFSIPYDFLFRREIQEAFGGGTISAAAIAAGLSTLARLIYILMIAGIIMLITGLLGFGLLIIFLLFLVQIVAETLAATLYLATREIIPEAVSNSIFWLALTFALSPSLVILHYYVSFAGIILYK